MGGPSSKSKELKKSEEEMKVEKKVFLKDLLDETEVPELPCLEMRISHQGDKHEQVKPSKWKLFSFLLHLP